jgi:hypothetical protein
MELAWHFYKNMARCRWYLGYCDILKLLGNRHCTILYLGHFLLGGI